MIPSPNEFLADFNRLPVISWLNGWHNRAQRGFVGWVTDHPVVALPLLLVYLSGALWVILYTTYPEWLGYRNINSKRLASSPMKQPVSLTSASEGARQLSEKTARVEDDDHPAAHAGKGGAPTFAKAVKEE